MGTSGKRGAFQERMVLSKESSFPRPSRVTGQGMNVPVKKCAERRTWVVPRKTLSPQEGREAVFFCIFFSPVRWVCTVHAATERLWSEHNTFPGSMEVRNMARYWQEELECMDPTALETLQAERLRDTVRRVYANVDRKSVV